MGSSLMSGGRLRRNVPCRVCHTCSSSFHVDPSIATPRHQADPVHKDTAGSQVCWVNPCVRTLSDLLGPVSVLAKGVGLIPLVGC